MGRPTNADGRQTRTAVLDAALDLFAEKGYFGTSLRDIATRVGVRESALYNYFASKEQLFEALIEAASEHRIELLTELTDVPIVDARTVLETLAAQSLDSYCQPRQEQFFRMLMADGIRLARSGRINLMERMNTGQMLMRGLIQRLMREGWLEPADPNMVWMAFVGPLLLWRHLNAIGAQHAALSKRQAFARAHVDQFLRGAGTRRALARGRTPRRRAATRIASPLRSVESRGSSSRLRNQG